jgi:hypothetical protein
MAIQRIVSVSSLFGGMRKRVETENICYAYVLWSDVMTMERTATLSQ